MQTPPCSDSLTSPLLRSLKTTRTVGIGLIRSRKKPASKGIKLAAEEYVPFNTTDFKAVGQRLCHALKDRASRKAIYVI